MKRPPKSRLNTEKINPRTAYIQGSIGAFVSAACENLNQANRIAHAAGSTVPKEMTDCLMRAHAELLAIPVIMDRVK